MITYNKRLAWLGLWVLILLAGLFGATYFILLPRPVDARITLTEPLEGPPQTQPAGPFFRVAVATVYRPIKSYRTYYFLGDHIASKLGCSLQMVSARNYQGIIDMFRRNEIDLAFVCDGVLLSAPDAMDAIVMPVIDGQPRYRSLLVVPADSPARTIEDLRGKRFLFTDPLSFTGCWYIRQKLETLGETPAHFFSNVEWTGSHDMSLSGLARRTADGASIGSAFYDRLVAENPSIQNQVRILESSPGYPSPPVVVRKSMPADERARVVKVFLGLSGTESGRMWLRQLGVDGFQPARNEDYASLWRPTP